MSYETCVESLPGLSAENWPSELQHSFIVLFMESKATVFNFGSEELEPA